MAALEELHMTAARRRSIRVACAFVALAWCATASAQTKGWTPAKTPDGQPDLQGTWIDFDSTPFEAALAQPAAPRPAAPGSTAAANVGPASEFADHNHQVSARAAIDAGPADGRVPVMKAEDKRDFDLEHLPDAPARNPLGALHHARDPRRDVSRGLQRRLSDHPDPGYVILAPR